MGPGTRIPWEAVKIIPRRPKADKASEASKLIPYPNLHLGWGQAHLRCGKGRGEVRVFRPDPLKLTDTDIT